MFFIFMVLVSQAFADPKAITLNEGAKAPFTGTLLNNEAVAEIIANKEKQEVTCGIRIDTAIKIESAKRQEEISIIDLKNQSCQKSLEELDMEYKSLSLKYNRLSTVTPVVTGLAFVGGVALTVLIAHSI